MQDRLKIRVWDKHEKSYWLQSTIEQNIHWLMNPEEYKDANYPPDCVEIEQCTGLRDKNGKLIYEGDIIRVEDNNCLITWDNDNAHYNVNGYGEIAYLNYNEIEVIGNIHENADLLENE